MMGAALRGAPSPAHELDMGNRIGVGAGIKAAGRPGIGEPGGPILGGSVTPGLAAGVRPVLMRRRSDRGVARNGGPAGRLWGGPSGRSHGIPRDELLGHGGVAPMVSPRVARPGRVRRRGRCAGCRVPRGGGNSERRRGGRIRGGRLGRARVRERRRGDQGRHDPMSFHEAPAPPRPDDPGTHPFRRLVLPHLERAGSKAQLTRPPPLPVPPPAAPDDGSRSASRPRTAPERAPAPLAAARAARDRRDSDPRT